MIRHRYGILYGILIIFVLSNLAVAAVNPLDVTFNDVLPGGYAQQPITLFFTQQQLVHSAIKGPSWMSLSQQSFVVDRHTPAQFQVIADPPADVHTGTYHATLILSHYFNQSGYLSNTIDIIVEVATKKLPAYVTNVTIFPSEESYPIPILLHVANTGNTIVSGTLQAENASATWQVLPTTEEDIALFLDPKEAGNYTTSIASTNQEPKTVTFQVFPQGTLTAASKVNVIHDAYAAQGNIVPIHVFFENSGQLPMLATARLGQAYHQQWVAPTQVVDLNLSLVAQASGPFHILVERESGTETITSHLEVGTEQYLSFSPLPIILLLSFIGCCLLYFHLQR